VQWFSGMTQESSDRSRLPDTLLAIVDEHRYIARLLNLLESEARNMQAARSADLQCAEDIMHYMVHFPDRYHHPKEDLIFDRMLNMDSDTASTVIALRKDHEQMASQAVQVLASIEKLQHREDVRLENQVDGSQAGDKQFEEKQVDEQQVGAVLLHYVAALREHMALEERKVLRPAATSLSINDWQAIDREIAPIVDPVFGGRIKQRYVRLMQRYLNNFVAIADSGWFPIKVIESVGSKVEQLVYTIFGVLGLAKNAIVRWLGGLRGRNPQSANDSRELSEDSLFDQFRRIVKSSGKPQTANTVEDISTISLHTDRELLAYQQAPFEPSKKIRTSWQAAVLNVFMRMTLKVLMRHIKIDKIKPDGPLRIKADYVPPGTVVEPVVGEDFMADWIRPEEPAGESGVVLHLPGGGFVTPASNKHRKMLGKLVCRTRRPVLLVSYRLLPEHPFPAGLEDALAAWRYLVAEGYRAEDIVLGGDSAGGTLALALMLALREEGQSLPCACMLLSPLTDLTFSTGSRASNRWRDPLLPSIRSGGAYEIYAGEHAIDDPLVSPVFGSFGGFPPTLALVSSSETLLDDTLIIARKARVQGVDFAVEIWHSLPHAWPIFSFLPESEMAVDRLVTFIGKSLMHIRSTADPDPDQAL